MDLMANPLWKRCLSFPSGSHREMYTNKHVCYLAADIARSSLFLVLYRFRRVLGERVFLGALTVS